MNGPWVTVSSWASGIIYLLVFLTLIGHAAPGLLAFAPKPVSRPASKSASSKVTTKNMEIAAWCRDHGIALGHNNRVPIEGLRAYRRAHAAQGTSAAA